MKNMEPA